MKGPTHSAVALHGWVLIFGEASRDDMHAL